jgi:hypothetical protein
MLGLHERTQIHSKFVRGLLLNVYEIPQEVKILNTREDRQTDKFELPYAFILFKQPEQDNVSRTGDMYMRDKKLIQSFSQEKVGKRDHGKRRRKWKNNNVIHCKRNWM